MDWNARLKVQFHPTGRGFTTRLQVSTWVLHKCLSASRHRIVPETDPFVHAYCLSFNIWFADHFIPTAGVWTTITTLLYLLSQLNTKKNYYSKIWPSPITLITSYWIFRTPYINYWPSQKLEWSLNKNIGFVNGGLWQLAMTKIIQIHIFSTSILKLI